jgi:ABC-type sugar transport system permease subunit
MMQMDAATAGGATLYSKKVLGHEKLWGLLLSTPAIIFYLIFMIFPTLNAFFLSFFKYDLFNVREFVGLRNYITLFSDRVFRWSFVVTFIYVFGTAVPITIVSLVSALILNQAMYGRSVFRILFYLPSVMSLVAVAIIFGGVFNSQGVINYFLNYLIGRETVIRWLSEMPSALYAIMITRVWRSFGYYMVIFLAGLQNIPTVYYEAAVIDGVSGWKQFRHITLPLLTPTTIIVTLVAVVNAFQAFTVPFVMTKGGPAERTSILPIQLYQTGFMYFKMGKASAISVIIFVIIVVFAITQFRMSRKYEQ